MRFLMALGAVALGVGCAHSSNGVGTPTPGQGATAQQLSAKAEKAYEALEFDSCADGFKAAAEVETDAAERAESFYRAAGCASLAGHLDAALTMVKRAVQSGYFDAVHLQYNPELVALHAQPDWEALVTEAQANLAKAPEAPFPVPTLAGLDAFGSRKVDREAVRRVFGLELGQPIVYSAAYFKQKEALLRGQYELAFAKTGMTLFFASEHKGKAFVVVDMVDVEDPSRLRFLPKPKGQLPDPEGLAARWNDYEQRIRSLQLTGKLDASSSCQVAHCIGGFGHPQLVDFEPEFLAKVPKQLDALTALLREDADDEKRAAAAFLLAYAPTPEDTVRRLVPSIRDSSQSVRNNVLRVLTALQQAATRPLMDVATVVDAVSMPMTSDRNKATYLLSYLLEDLPADALKEQRAGLIRQLGETLVAMSALQQPINRDPAVMVLKQLSGEAHETAEAWREWLSLQSRTER
ncbi:HEAT repeat domain-containing protein [Comamonas sp. JC664]|uniref:HEAT repeat domain-containing protein n=1 Tax=Comamonas sp. JC664 TaxID=2801917 RepID=UPI00174E7F3A|nr:HEAT repeat domain-containing protein [Comamonas sp. JC664]MBL0698550.1 HEAT repeat domain-containing protein [Comamonas sp. JC664]GHH00424.1 hypothetical protein GCM10012319_67540 [Comamonas sp. KCTC 72670]